FHIDGLRVDAVASMLYLDYSREPGQWVPNRFGGRENLGAIELLREVNTVVGDEVPTAMMIAEESTSWPKVTHPVHLGGLGFSHKWNMGWMHDTLGYFERDTIHRQWHHNDLTFGLLYAFGERYVLPLSHDEVVHGKASLLGKMPGDDWQRFANLRALYAWMWALPGAPLLFMGAELAPFSEWNEAAGLPWHLLDHAPHRGVRDLVATLNAVAAEATELWAGDTDSSSFQWLDADDALQGARPPDT
ncbi:MAG TPA: 1,4-alpha-glucan branching enzyme, partial [Ilumatobacteraceae bacterium]|nr:1,4-alpha-glucan branching enzyme [Ilumatobacteraceae bacterium]